MNSVLKKLIIVIVILLSVIQINVNNIVKRRLNDYRKVDAVSVVKHKELNELNKELSDLYNTTILSANKVENIWYAKVKINGTKDEILAQMKKLYNYEIKNYNINKNNNEKCVILEICGIKTE